MIFHQLSMYLRWSGPRDAGLGLAPPRLRAVAARRMFAVAPRPRRRGQGWDRLAPGGVCAFPAVGAHNQNLPEPSMWVSGRFPDNEKVPP